MVVSSCSRSAGDRINDEISPSINRLKSQISFSSRTASSLGMLSQISEIGSEDIETTSLDDVGQGSSNGDAQQFGHGFPYASWNDTTQLSKNLSGLKRGRSGNEKMFSDVQVSEMVAMEKLLQFPNSVPCKIRAKRGCATHPRSIAERVRRTRVSERMRKLQELKNTNQ
ncbi:putative transcription factor [Sesbania bispinosa]|nr:putative transcription factor [Sesbania bispinosa]